MPGKLNDKVALVTGGSSGNGSGNGRAVRRRRRARLYHRPTAGTTQRRHRIGVGPRLRGVVADASGLDDIDRVFSTIRSEAGRLDVLFASAGVGNLTEPLAEVTPDSFDQMFGLNVRGTLFTAQKAAELMTSGGSIILNGSAAAEKAMPGSSVYAASKAGLKAFARVWSAELAPRGVRVNVLASRAHRHADPRRTTPRSPRLSRVTHDHRPPRPTHRDRHRRPVPRQFRLQLRHRHRAVRHGRDGPILRGRRPRRAGGRSGKPAGDDQAGSGARPADQQDSGRLVPKETRR